MDWAAAGTANLIPGDLERTVKTELPELAKKRGDVKKEVKRQG